MTTRRWRPVEIALVGLIALVGTVYAVAILNAVPPHPDLDVYLRGARDLAQARPLYDPFLHQSGDPALRDAFIYPPLFAILMLPLLLVPTNVVPVVWLMAMHAALAAAFILVWRRLRASRATVLLALLITVAFYPLWVDASQAQANLPILLLITLGVLGISDGKSRAGIWIGFAAALKLTPALLLIWLLVERRFRAAAWVLGGFAGFSAVGAVVRPVDSLTYARVVAPQLAGGTAYFSNESIAGVVDRFFTSNPYTTPLVTLPWAHSLIVVLALGTLGAWIWMARGMADPLMRALTFLPIVPLVSALSWEHHLVILLPLVWLTLAVLASRGWPLAEAAAVAVAVLALLAIPHLPIGPPYATDFARAAHTKNPLWLAGANRLFIGTALLLIVSPWLLSRAGPAAQPSTAMETRRDRATPPSAAA